MLEVNIRVLFFFLDGFLIMFKVRLLLFVIGKFKFFIGEGLVGIFNRVFYIRC